MDDVADLVTWSADLARQYLAVPEFADHRWRHVQAVAGAAVRLRHLFDRPAANLLCAAAWTHDLGYAPDLAATGFHPLDGARALADAGAPAELCALVAHHSGAVHEARLRGLAVELGEWTDQVGPVRDALWRCDMTTGPTGAPVGFDQRYAEIRERYGPDHVVPRAIGAAADDIRAAITATEARAAAAGLALA